MCRIKIGEGGVLVDCRLDGLEGFLVFFRLLIVSLFLDETSQRG